MSADNCIVHLLHFSSFVVRQCGDLCARERTSEPKPTNVRPIKQNSGCARRRPIVFTCFAVTIGILTSAFDAGAKDQFQRLDDKHIRLRVVGQDIADGPLWTMYVRPDGTLIGEKSGNPWTGVWKIQNNKLCITLPSTTTLECNEVWMRGNFIRMRANKDQETFDAVVTAHGTKQ